MSKKWEFTTFKCSASTDDVVEIDNELVDVENSITGLKQLNKLGSEGWQPWGDPVRTSFEGRATLTYTMKRQID